MKRDRIEYAGRFFYSPDWRWAGMKGRRGILLCLPVLLMMFSLTGCSMLGGDVENLLSPPHAGGN